MKDLAFMRRAPPPLCTTARLGVVSQPMHNERPTTPSCPTTATSDDAPSSIACSSDTTDVVGNQTCFSVSPASYSTLPCGRSMSSIRRSQRLRSAIGSAASSQFSWETQTGYVYISSMLPWRRGEVQLCVVGRVGAVDPQRHPE